MISGLPQRLKKLRMSYGYSQQSVSKQLKISASIISAYETGERTPSIENLISLSNLYRCSIDYLLGKSIGNSEIIDVSGLTPTQINLINELIAQLRK